MNTDDDNDVTIMWCDVRKSKYIRSAKMGTSECDSAVRYGGKFFFYKKKEKENIYC